MKLTMNNISSLPQLAKLTMNEYQEVGIEGVEDRKKMYTLVQSIKAKLNGGESGESAEEGMYAK